MSGAANCNRRVVNAGFFFQWLAPSARAAHALRLELAGGEFAASAAHGLGMQSEPRGGARVAAVAAEHGEQAGEQAAQLFIEQAGEQREGGGEVRRGRHGRGNRGQYRAGGTPRRRLAAAAQRVRRAVQGAPSDLQARHGAPAHQLAQGLVGAHAEAIIEFVGPAAEIGRLDEGLDRRQQGAVNGETDALMLPQAVGVKAGASAQGVEAAAVGVAGQVGQLAEQAEDGTTGRTTERGHKVRHRGDRPSTQFGGEIVQGVDRGSHRDIMSYLINQFSTSCHISD